MCRYFFRWFPITLSGPHISLKIINWRRKIHAVEVETGFIHWWGITFHGHDGTQNYNDETLK